jgi:hypothetical protein
MLGEFELEDKITVSVWDMSDGKSPLVKKPGFYYSLDIDDDQNEEGEETIKLCGPYSTQEAALAAAEAFVADADTEHDEDDDLEDEEEAA